jgi:malonyl-CoA O-methyltransferase
MDKPESTIPDKKQISRAFSRKAGSYDISAMVQRRICELLATLIQPAADGRRELWLDLGCGTGLFESIASGLTGHKSIIALDLAEQSLRALQKKKLSLTFPLCADIADLPFRGCNFDRIICTSTLQWFDDQEKIVAKIGSHLKPNGYFYFGIFCNGTLHALQELQKTYGITPPVRFINPDLFRQACDQAGFETIHVDRLTVNDYFPTAHAFLRNISNLGGTATTGIRLSPKILTRFCNDYEAMCRTEKGVGANYHIMVGVARKKGAA